MNDERYASLLGTPSGKLQAFKNLTREQITFLRAMAALDIADWFPYNRICKHAEHLYSGEIYYTYKWKDIVARVLNPLRDAGLIEVRKKAKQAQDAPEWRGGKPADVKPTGKFDTEVAEPLLAALHKSAGYAEIRTIRGKPLADIVAEIEQGTDQQKRGKALELLAIRLCQMLDLQFMGWHETDEQVAESGEAHALLHAARLTYSRWQVQCKAGPVTLEAVAKEVGMKYVTGAGVILVVGTKKATESAQTYRTKVVSTSDLNIIIIDGPLLRTVIKDSSAIVGILNREAPRAMSRLPSFSAWLQPAAFAQWAAAMKGTTSGSRRLGMVTSSV